MRNVTKKQSSTGDSNTVNDDIVWEDDICHDTDTNINTVSNTVLGVKGTGTSHNSLPPWAKEFIRAGSILNINGSLYCHLSESGGWYPLRSNVTMKAMSTCLKQYAPVNFATAIDPYCVIIESVSWPMVVVCETFTQSNLRYKYTIDEDTNIVTFEPNIVLENDKGPTPKNTLCTIPVSNMTPILQFDLRYSTTIVKTGTALVWLRQVFGNNIKTILWAIGDMLYDGSNKRMFILYGPGGVGKSSVVNIIAAAIGGTIPVISPDYIVYKPNNYYNKVVNANILMEASSSRLVNVPDVENNNYEEINMQNIKALTGGDEINGMKVSVTLLMSVNNLFHYEHQSNYTRTDRVRRIVVVPTVARRDNDNSDLPPLHQDSIDELMQFAIRTRIKYSKPPLRVDALLCTLFQNRYKDALKLITIDYTANEIDCMVATQLLCWIFNIASEEMDNCLRWVGTESVIEYAGCYFIANIKAITNTTIPDNSYPVDTRIQSRRYNNMYKSTKSETPMF